MPPKLLEVFKAGTHTDMNGVKRTFTDEDIQASVAAYDPAVFAAPFVIGHPKLDAPAYGWLAKLTTDGALMKGEPEKVEPQFAEMVNDGRFSKISMSFFAPDSPHNPKPGVWYPRHVGFLGAQAPAVKGLKQASFADSPDDVFTVEFSAPWVEGGWSLTRLFRNLREHFIEKDGIEEADKIIPDYMINDIQEAAQNKSRNAAFAEPDPPQTEETTMPDDNNADFAQRETDLQQREQAIADREQKIKDQEAKARQDDIASFADGLVDAGKVLPRDRDALVEFMANLNDGDTVSFAESGTTVTKTNSDWLRQFLSSMPVQVDFSERNTADDDENTASFAVPAGYAVDARSLEIHNKAKAYQQKHQCDYATAVSAVS